MVGSEFGVPIDGAIINVRDAAPLCAGLIFGPTAGILAGVIGGLERWFAVLWGARPMILANGCAVMCAVAPVSLLSRRERRGLDREHRQLTQTFSKWLSAVVLVAFCATSVFAWFLQTSWAENSSRQLLKLNLDDVKRDILDASDENLLELTRGVAADLNAAKDIDRRVVGAAKNRHVGENGYLIIAAEDWTIVSGPHGDEGENLLVAGIWLDTAATAEYARFESGDYGERCCCMYTVTEGYYIIAVTPARGVVFSRDLSVFITIFMEILVFAALFVLVYLLIKKLVVENIHEINHSLREITGGNLNVSVNVRTNEEFVSLSDDINSTVLTLKGYIAQAAARLDKELEVAKVIQSSTLPSVFPPYPKRTDFDIFAQMDTAREVGGDFYDFYLLDDDRLAFLIADVSGKGITAAMFMMKAKTLIKNYAEKEGDVADILTHANQALNALEDVDARTVCRQVKADVDAFAGDADQFDDITMLHLRLLPQAVLELRPTLAELGRAAAFVEDTLREAGADEKTVVKMNIAVDEIFSNIARYSGADKARLECAVTAARVTVRFVDNGRPYDPTQQVEPDVTLSAEERGIGGLGIFMVKKSMDGVEYAYENNHNILTLWKNR